MKYIVVCFLFFKSSSNFSVVDDYFEDWEEMSEEEEGDRNEEDGTNRRSDVPKTKRGKTFIDARLVAALDKCKVSSGFAVHLLTAVISALGLQVSDYTVSRATIERTRKEYRKEMAKKIKSDFHENVIKF